MNSGPTPISRVLGDGRVDDPKKTKNGNTARSNPFALKRRVISRNSGVYDGRCPSQGQSAAEKPSSILYNCAVGDSKLPKACDTTLAVTKITANNAPSNCKLS